MKIKNIFILFSLFVLFLFSRNAFSQDKNSVGNIANVVGHVEIIRNGKHIKAEKELPIYETDQIVTHDSSAVKVIFKDGSNFMGFKNTVFKVSEYNIKNKKSGGTNLDSLIDVVKGSARFFVKPKEGGANDSKFKTPNAVMLIRGTQGFIKVNPDTFSVSSGTVQVALLKEPTRYVTCVEGYTVSGANLKLTKTPESERMRNESQLNIFGVNVKESRDEIKVKEGEKDSIQEKGGDELIPKKQNQGESGSLPVKGQVVINTDGSSSQTFGPTQSGNTLLPFLPPPIVNPASINSATTVNEIQTEISRIFAPTAPIPTATSTVGQEETVPTKLIINLNPEN